MILVNEGHEAFIRENANKIIASLCSRLVEHKEELVEMCIERASTVGVAEYGDTSFSKPIEYLEVDVDEELSDAIFYESIVELLRIS